jgi:transcriptional regulator with XRE-family HTH domain
VLRKRLGERVRALRKTRKLSQIKLAELAKVSWTHLGSIERAERATTTDVIDRLCKALRCSPDDLLADHPEQRHVEALLEDTPPRLRERYLDVTRAVIELLREATEPAGKRKS